MLYTNSIDIDVNRCLCIHSISQPLWDPLEEDWEKDLPLGKISLIKSKHFTKIIVKLVDITLQSLLYQRQIIPEPVLTLSKGDSYISQQFRSVYEKVAQILQKTFRSPNAKLISEFIILLGSAPYSPKEIYRIKCRNDEHEIEKISILENNGEKKEEVNCCEELSAKEKRLIFSAIALSKTAVEHFENCPIPGKTDKVFMFIKTTDKLQTWAEGLNEDLSFKLPENIPRKRQIRQLRIKGIFELF
uniref:HORMA domain-containing protein n=1 Tax=Meloidogyne javanica TaxID=6303 RepID=A0A915N797_MELJA